MAILIKNGTLITASETFEADILIEGETISLIGKDLQHPGAQIIDATGRPLRGSDTVQPIPASIGGDAGGFDAGVLPPLDPPN